MHSDQLTKQGYGNYFLKAGYSRKKISNSLYCRSGV